MIEFGLAKDGQRIFRWKGRSLCSQIHPRNEAFNWVEKQTLQQLDRARSFIVLGAGCGFHLVELYRRYPSKKILVIETLDEISTACQSLHSLELASVEFVQPDDLAGLKNSIKLKKSLKESFRVLEFKPAMITDQDLYKRVAELLIGRDIASLEYHLSLRGELANSFAAVRKNTSQSHLSPVRLLSIKDLEESMRSSDATFQIRASVNILRELIK